METTTIKDEEPEEQIPYCPACKTKCVREEVELKSLRTTVRAWVCPAQKYPSCI